MRTLPKKIKNSSPFETPKSYLDDSWVWVLSCIRLFATPWTVAHQAPLSMGILQARILEWVVLPSSRGFSWPRDWTCISSVSCISGWVLYHSRHLILLYCWEVLWEISLFHFIWLVSEFHCLQNPTPPSFGLFVSAWRWLHKGSWGSSAISLANEPQWAAMWSKSDISGCPRSQAALNKWS